MGAYTTTMNGQVRRSYCHVIIRGVCVGLLLTSEVWLSVPSSTWASVYTCIDQTGRTVLTNRKAGFKNCRIILQDATGESKSGTGKTPKNISHPTNDEMTSSFTNTSPPPNMFPNDPLMPWTSAPPTEAAPSQPCTPGFNPLNPISTAPCVQSDESQSSGTVQPH